MLVGEVQVRDVPLTREWVGEIRGEADIEIRARVQGFLEEIHFLEGGKVKKGQLLYSIDQSELLQSVTAAEADLAEAKTLLANAESDVRRYRPLAEMNAVSQRDLENAVAREEATRSSVEAAEAGLRLAQISLSYAEVRAPMDGLIGLTQAKVGDFVGSFPNPVVLNTISDIEPVHVRFAITEREYLQFARRFSERIEEIEAGSLRKYEGEARLELILADGSVHPHRGRTKTVGREIDANTGTLTVEAAFPNPGGLLRPGQYAKVRAEYDVLKGALLVPQRAVQELQGQYRVWVVEEEDTVRSRFVQPGVRVEDLWVIDAGLEPGLRIVVEGTQRLRDDLEIVARPYEPPTADPVTPSTES